MKKITLFPLLALLFSHHAWAVLGPNFLDSARPHSICAIEYFVKGTQRVDEICSAVVIGERHLLTAAHCTPGLPERDHRIFCRDQVEAQIVEIQINSKIQLERLRFGEEEHRLDTALLTIDRDLEIPAIKFSANEAQTRSIIDSAQICGIFGHGGFRERLRNAGYSTNAKIQPEQIEFEEDLIRIKGFGGLNSGLVEPGDSGGSLACLDQTQGWVHLAQVSGRTMSAESLFAPVYLFSEELELLQVSSIDSKHANLQQISQRWIKEDQKKELEQCLISHRVFVKDDFVTTDDLQADALRCVRDQVQQLRTKLSEQDEVILRIRPYSLIEVEQKRESILISHRPSIERILNGENPFSTVDHQFMQFKVRNIDSEFAYGDVNIFGYTEYFNCSENILCDGGLYKNIKVKIADLVFPVR